MKKKIGFIFVTVVLAALFVLPVVAFAEEGEQPQEEQLPEIVLTKENITIALGEEENVYYLISNKDKYEKGYIFSTSNGEILSVTDEGIFRGVGIGQAEIIISTVENIGTIDEQTGETAVTARVGIVATITVNVGKAAQSIKFNATRLALGLGETFDLNVSTQNGVAYRRTFSSSDLTVAKVNGKGIVTPVGVGEAIIYATIFDGKTVECRVTVTNNPTKISITSKNTLVQKGSTNHKITTKISNNEITLHPVFSVANTKRATITQKGVVTALVTGQTTVRVKTEYDNIYATQVITVVDNAFELSRNTAQIALDYPNVTRVEYGTSVQGRKLEAYVITNRSTNKYKKTLFMTFAVHGFEDAYSRDGKVLVSEARKIISYYASHSTELGTYRLVIVPCANPDGTVAGKNNLRAERKAFGRCTAKHIDMNRDFNKFAATESKCLKKLLDKYKPNVFLDVHGWYDETLGTKKLNGIIMKTQGFTTRKDNKYGTDRGYIIGYVHKQYAIPTALVEYKDPKNVSLTRDVNMINSIVKAY